METEDTGTDRHIPSLADYMAAVHSRMVESASADSVDHQLADDIACVFTAKTANDTDLFNLVAFGQGCHAAAEVYRSRGDVECAGLYHAMGQDMLSKAMEVFGVLMAIGLHQVGVSKH